MSQLINNHPYTCGQLCAAALYPMKKAMEILHHNTDYEETFITDTVMEHPNTLELTVANAGAYLKKLDPVLARKLKYLIDDIHAEIPDSYLLNKTAFSEKEKEAFLKGIKDQKRHMAKYERM